MGEEKKENFNHIPKIDGSKKKKKRDTLIKIVNGY
jgi:hypothetical protein